MSIEDIFNYTRVEKGYIVFDKKVLDFINTDIDDIIRELKEHYGVIKTTIEGVNRDRIDEYFNNLFKNNRCSVKVFKSETIVSIILIVMLNSFMI